jgi:hypothetical protein
MGKVKWEGDGGRERKRAEGWERGRGRKREENLANNQVVLL